MSDLVRGKGKSKQRNGFSSFAFEGARVLATGLLTGVGVKLGSNLVEKAMSSSSRVRVDNDKFFKSVRK